MPLFETKRVELPGEAWADIRELSVPELQEADRKGTESAVALMDMLPEKIVEAQMERQRDQAMERIIRYEGYDPATLIQYGLTDWSFDEDCDEEHRNQLGAKNGEIVARAVFELSVIPSGEVVDSSLRSLEGASQVNSAEPIPLITPEASLASPTTTEPLADS